MLFMHVDNPGGKKTNRPTVQNKPLIYMLVNEPMLWGFTAHSALFVIMEKLNGKSQTGFTSS